MKNKKKVIMIAVMSCLLAAAVLLSTVMSYLIDQRQTDNIFTLGTVTVSLTETNYPKDPDSRVLVPYGSIPKNPQIANIGENDAFVFMKITVPKLEVEPIKNDGSLKYSDKVSFDENNKRTFQTDLMEIFNFKSDSPVSKRADLEKPDSQELTADEEGLYNKDWYKLDNVDYNENWYLIDKTVNEDSKTNTYLFAYKSVLFAAANVKEENQKTKTEALFDEVQLKTFVENETLYQSFQKIKIEAYAIQADKLKSITDLDKINPEVWQLKKIYDVYKNQSEVGQ